MRLPPASTTTVACLWLLSGACAPYPPDPVRPGSAGDAHLVLRLDGGTDLVVDHVPGQSEVVASTPQDGVFTASFKVPDPSLSLDIRVDSTRVREGDRLVFPLSGARSAADLRISSSILGVGYLSERGGARGTLDVDLLTITENAVDFRCSFTLQLPDPDGRVMSHTGFLEAHQGSTVLDR